MLDSFFAYSSTNGVRVAAATLNQNTVESIVTGAGPDSADLDAAFAGLLQRPWINRLPLTRRRICISQRRLRAKRLNERVQKNIVENIKKSDN